MEKGPVFWLSVYVQIITKFANDCRKESNLIVIVITVNSRHFVPVGSYKSRPISDRSAESDQPVSWTGLCRLVWNSTRLSWLYEYADVPVLSTQVTESAWDFEVVMNTFEWSSAFSRKISKSSHTSPRSVRPVFLSFDKLRPAIWWPTAEATETLVQAFRLSGLLQFNVVHCICAQFSTDYRTVAQRSEVAVNRRRVPGLSTTIQEQKRHSVVFGLPTSKNARFEKKSNFCGF